MYDAQLKIGDKIPISGINSATADQTLLLVLQKGCRDCEANSPFYRYLVDETRKSGKIHLVAILPQEPAEGRQYMYDLGIHIDEIKQYPLKSLKVQSTPTLLLVNNSGVVTKGWVGLLKPGQESELLRLCCNN